VLDDAIYARLSLLSGEYAHVSHQTVYPPLPMCGPCSSQYQNACVTL